MTSNFRFQGKHIFLTYAQCDIPKELVLELLKNIEVFTIADYIIAEEKHADGNPHIHAVLSFERKLHTRDVRCFDLVKDGNRFHPNVTSPTSLQSVKDYVIKGGEYITSRPTYVAKGAGLAALVKNSVSRKDFLDSVITTDSGCRQWTQAKGIAEYLWGATIEPYVSKFLTSSFSAPLEVAAWAEGTIGKGHSRPRGLVLWSHGSGLGKTQWARSLGRHIHWCGEKDLSLWDPEAEYLVMDDIEWQYVPNKKPFFGAQEHFTMTDKYKGKKTVDWGKPLIFLCNYNPQECEGWGQWYDERMIVVEITHKMF